MKLRHVIAITMILALWSASVMAASPEGGVMDTRHHTITPKADKALGDPDFAAAARAAADYVMHLQADVTEDNALNGDINGDDSPVDDPDDAGFDWYIDVFTHTTAVSPGNLYGVTLNSLYQLYKVEPTARLWTGLTDGADWMITHGSNVLPYDIDSGPDMLFLLDYAKLPGVADPSIYQDAARAIWDDKMLTYTPATLLDALFVWANGAGQPGLAAWDVASFCEGLMELEGLYPGFGYGADAVTIADLLWDDSIAETTFNFNAISRPVVYDYYTLGISGLIRVFDTTGTHTSDIATLQGLLLDSQYANGGFSHQYGTATPGLEDYQVTAYALWALHDNLDMTSGAVISAFQNGAEFLASEQDASGGFVYSGGFHVPEEGSECAAALVYAMDATSVVATADGPNPATCGLTKTVTFDYNRNDLTPGLRGYEVVFEVTGGAVTFDLDDINPSATLAGAGATFYQELANVDGTFTVNESILGATVGLLADGPLFTVNLHTDTDGTAAVNIVSYKLRDPDNTFIFADMIGTSFVVDCTAPDAVTGITAAPGNNKVNVSWTHTGTDVATYEVYRGLWYNGTLNDSAYPEYDDLAGDVIPTRPTGYGAYTVPGEWVLAGTVSVGTNSFPDTWPVLATRGVYYYEVFAIDAATNPSAIAAANDQATSYWLGDVTGVPDAPNPNTDPQGEVDSIDMSELSASFGMSGFAVGAPQYVLDVGPTDDWSRVGIPSTDNAVNFEDLMVFSMNFGVVAAAKDLTPVSNVVDLAWVTNTDGSMALRLVNGTGLKGLRVQAAQPVNHVVAGQLLDDQSELTFLKNVGSNLDANVAVMGMNNGFSGSGDLMVIAANSLIKAEDLTITARGIDNSEMTVNLDKTSATTTPRVFALHANYPNPFNPMTKISFSLPEAQTVELTVYSLDGRKVATLIHGTQSAGLHEVVWMGRDDAGRTASSGTYFYRINAGPYSQVHKMTLMK